jgi:L-ascorbate metabolism protein UlaG (beta-lactamase superfamily)
MQLQLIRSATLRLVYARKQILIDPYLAARFSRPSYAGVSPNPLVDLPCSPQEVIAGVELALISHLHSDHFDPTGQALLPKDLPVFCQPEDQVQIETMGFGRVEAIPHSLVWQGITITRIPGQHGSGTVLEEMGSASGFVFQSDGEPSLYWAGDTLWCQAVAEAIAHFQPELIVTHSCGAMWGDRVLIVMDAAQTAAVCQAAPQSKVIATHLDALDHATVTRQALRDYALAQGIGPERLLIPYDGEKLIF